MSNAASEVGRYQSSGPTRRRSVWHPLGQGSYLRPAIEFASSSVRREPRASRKFFDRFQGRILFGTDAVPKGEVTPQQVSGDAVYEIYYRFLETEDQYFDYAPARKPPQGRWRIYGLGLAEPICKKVHYQSAERLLGIKIPA